MAQDKTRDTNSIPYTRIISIFIKAGVLSFGGWSATVVLLEKELGNSTLKDRSVDLKVAAAYAQILPGTTQVAIVSNVGYQLRGLPGALVATISYLVPAISLITAFAWIYFGYFHHANLLPYLNGLIPALAGIILANAYRIGSKHVTHPMMWGLVIAACLSLLLFKIHALLIILGYGIFALLISLGQRR